MKKTLGCKGTFEGGVLADGIVRSNQLLMDGMTSNNVSFRCDAFLRLR